MVENRKILIATGGTGGHVYPALVTGEELRRRGWEVCFIGKFAPSACDKLEARDLKYANIMVKGFVSKSLWQKLLAAGCLVRAFFSCAWFTVRFQPDKVLGFGGYSSFPASVVGKALGVMVMAHEQNVHPGEANKVLGRIVDKVAVSFKDSMTFFPPGKCVWTGYPMRPFGQARSRAEALKAFGLEQGRKTILVFGGSQGSHAINQCIAACLESAGAVSGERLQGCIRETRLAPWQVIHLTGQGEAAAVRQRYARLPFPSYVQEYMENIQDAYAAADIVIARAGAGTVTELGLLGIPAILVPYPYAQSHQDANARVLERCGVAVIIQEKDLNPSMLGDKIFEVLAHASPGDVNRSRSAEHIVSDAVTRLADEVERL